MVETYLYVVYHALGEHVFSKENITEVRQVQLLYQMNSVSAKDPFVFFFHFLPHERLTTNTESKTNSENVLIFNPEARF